MPKQVYTWGKVTAGDIISFRYKGKKPTSTLTTLLVLNPRIPYTRKDKTKTFHLVGLKLESLGNVPTIKAKPILVQLLERTYDYKEAKKAGVFLEPIKLPKPLVEVLVEN